jgi:hypothetical protein
MEFFGKVFKGATENALEDYIYKKHGFQDEDVFC